MKKIGVISDTHLSGGTWGLRSAWNKILTRGGNVLKDILAREFQGIDLIVHAGDIVELWVLDLLRDFAPVEAVAGNMDSPEVHQELPPKKVLEVEGVSIGVIHGSGPPQGIIERISREFSEVEAILFGHTHTPCEQMREGVLFFNPGSPTDRFFAPFNSLGILTVDSSQSNPTQRLQGHIIRVD